MCTTTPGRRAAGLTRPRAAALALVALLAQACVTSPSNGTTVDTANAVFSGYAAVPGAEISIALYNYKTRKFHAKVLGFASKTAQTVRGESLYSYSVKFNFDAVEDRFCYWNELCNGSNASGVAFAIVRERISSTALHEMVTFEPSGLNCAVSAVNAGATPSAAGTQCASKASPIMMLRRDWTKVVLSSRERLHDEQQKIDAQLAALKKKTQELQAAFDRYNTASNEAIGMMVTIVQAAADSRTLGANTLK